MLKRTAIPRSNKPIRSRAKRKSLDKILDELWSELVKLLAENKCELCGETKGLNSHHFYSRSRMSVRWDPQNGVALCPYHHTLGNDSAHKAPADFVDWMQDKRGEAWFNELHENAHRLYKASTDDKREIIQSLRDRIEELKEC